MNGLFLLLLAVCLMGGGWLLWQSVQEPEETEPPYDWSADWHLMLLMESEKVDALISVQPKTWSQLNEEETWLR